MELPSTGVPVGLTAEQVREQAPQRWFNTTELCEIFAKHDTLNIHTSQPQERPTSGAFFVIDMQRLRKFKKDGHIWAKKKDGKRIQESHENLKVDGEKKLNCLYAHGETEENLRRRIYRMIEKKGHGAIALFHYREDKKGWNNGKRCKTTNTSNLSNIQASAASGGCVPFEGTENDFPPIPGMPSIPGEWLATDNSEELQESIFPKDSGKYIIGDYFADSEFESLLSRMSALY